MFTLPLFHKMYTININYMKCRTKINVHQIKKSYPEYRDGGNRYTPSLRSNLTGLCRIIVSILKAKINNYFRKTILSKVRYNIIFADL